MGTRVAVCVGSELLAASQNTEWQPSPSRRATGLGSQGSRQSTRGTRTRESQRRASGGGVQATKKVANRNADQGLARASLDDGRIPNVRGVRAAIVERGVGGRRETAA